MRDDDGRVETVGLATLDETFRVDATSGGRLFKQRFEWTGRTRNFTQTH